tara:strand:- start:254 stop:1258 length:1005 start_codon:yes stop_codon:yes gene_type:complete
LCGNQVKKWSTEKKTNEEYAELLRLWRAKKSRERYGYVLDTVVAPHPTTVGRLFAEETHAPVQKDMSEATRKRNDKRGRPPSLDPKEKKKIPRMMDSLETEYRKREVTAAVATAEINKKLEKKGKPAIKKCSMKKYLNSLGYKFLPTRKKPLLTQKKADERLRFAQKYIRKKKNILDNACSLAGRRDVEVGELERGQGPFPDAGGASRKNISHMTTSKKTRQSREDEVWDNLPLFSTACFDEVKRRCYKRKNGADSLHPGRVRHFLGKKHIFSMRRSKKNVITETVGAVSISRASLIFSFLVRSGLPAQVQLPEHPGVLFDRRWEVPTLGVLQG